MTKCKNYMVKRMNESERSYVVIEFATVQNLYDKRTSKDIILDEPQITEVAAVKIKNGQIQGHYHSFVSIEGYDVKDIDFDEYRASAFYADAAHLIGAPAFSTVAEKLHEYLKDSTIVLRSDAVFLINVFDGFKAKAQSVGLSFDNEVVNISDILAASKLKNAIEDSGETFETMTALQLSKFFMDGRGKWSDIFCDYDIIFDPDSDDPLFKGRDDPLGWTLAFAKLFIVLTADDGDLKDCGKLPF